MHDQGWARRVQTPEVQSIVWHFFRYGVAICANRWRDPQEPILAMVPPGCMPCPRCVALRLER